MLEISCLGLHPIELYSPFVSQKNAVKFIIPMQGCWFGGGLEYFAKRLTKELLTRLQHNTPFCVAMFPNDDYRTWVQKVNGHEITKLLLGAVYEALKSQGLSMGEWASHTGLAIHLLVSWDANPSNKRVQS